MNCGRKQLMSQAEYREKVCALIEQQWLPEQISNRLKLEQSSIQISFPTIYRTIHSGKFDPKGNHGYVRKGDQYARSLREKGEKHTKRSDRRRSRFPDAPHISERPQAANGRSCVGHWDADTIAGKKGTACILTLTDRRSRYLPAAKVAHNTAEVVSEVMLRLLSHLPAEQVLSVTPDRGSEFANYTQISACLHQVSFYFPDPYSPWLRGINKNTNGLLREYFPKYQDITPVSECSIADAVFRINLRPRKCLAWRSPFESFFELVLHLT